MRALRHLQDAEQTHEEPEEAPKIGASNWPKTLEALQEFLRGFLGTTKVPLSYVIREAADPPAANVTPVFGQADSPYNTLEEEMVAREPHNTGGANPVLTAKGFTFVPLHITFDVKFELRRKARMVA